MDQPLLIIMTVELQRCQIRQPLVYIISQGVAIRCHREPLHSAVFQLTKKAKPVETWMARQEPQRLGAIRLQNPGGSQVELFPKKRLMIAISSICLVRT
jgi:hypothetical protein